MVFPPCAWYRIAPHSTSDDPTKYRAKDDQRAWPLGDPIERLKRHLVRLGEWSEEQHARLSAELESEIAEAAKKAIAYGTLHSGPRLSPATISTKRCPNICANSVSRQACEGGPAYHDRGDPRRPRR
jgi:dehydrogenase E1 component